MRVILILAVILIVAEAGHYEAEEQRDEDGRDCQEFSSPRWTTDTKRERKSRYRRTTPRTTLAQNLDVSSLNDVLCEHFSTNLTVLRSWNRLGRAGTNNTNITVTTTAAAPSANTTTSSTNISINVTEGISAMDFGYLTGTLMGKCFVCGLEDREIPRHAHCSDAFTRDATTQQSFNDTTGLRHRDSFRKYCRWMDVPKYMWNASVPRSLWGRWTGGCSVRWIDISGIYTQRTCRNRHRAIMGKHWVSKRMAKLEMAMQHEDNDCVSTPMASLVPLSRGVSLYSRFHACVCTGEWCNGAIHTAQCTNNIITFIFLPLLFSDRTRA